MNLAYFGNDVILMKTTDQQAGVILSCADNEDVTSCIEFLGGKQGLTGSHALTPGLAD